MRENWWCQLVCHRVSICPLKYVNVPFRENLLQCPEWGLQDMFLSHILKLENDIQNYTSELLFHYIYVSITVGDKGIRYIDNIWSDNVLKSVHNMKHSANTSNINESQLFHEIIILKNILNCKEDGDFKEIICRCYKVELLYSIFIALTFHFQKHEMLYKLFHFSYTYQKHC